MRAAGAHCRVRYGMENEGVIIEHPNRERPESKATKATVVLLLLASAALMLIVLVFGWSVLEGQKLVSFGYVIVYLLLAYYVSRWTRGALPIAAALAIILAILCVVAGPGWFERDKTGYAAPETIFGGTGLDADLLGLLVLLIVPVQILLIAFGAQGFRQAWNVELEVPADRAGGAGGHPGGPGPAIPPATA